MEEVHETRVKTDTSLFSKSGTLYWKEMKCSLKRGISALFNTASFTGLMQKSVLRESCVSRTYQQQVPPTPQQLLGSCVTNSAFGSRVLHSYSKDLQRWTTTSICLPVLGPILKVLLESEELPVWGLCIRVAVLILHETASTDSSESWLLSPSWNKQIPWGFLEPRF